MDLTPCLTARLFFSDTMLKTLQAKRIDRPCFRSFYTFVNLLYVSEHRDQVSFSLFAPFCEISVLAELALGHMRYSWTDVLPQSNSPPGSVLESNHARV